VGEIADNSGLHGQREPLPWQRTAPARPATGKTLARRLKPSLEGSPLEVCLALLSGDHAPAEAAEYVLRCMNPGDYETFPALGGARLLYRAASHLSELEDIPASLNLLHLAKKGLRDVALAWLGPRTCECCLEMRHRLKGR